MHTGSKILGVALILMLNFQGAMILSNASIESADKRFEALAKKYIEQLLEMNPETATNLGDHRFDNRLDDYSLKGVERDRAFNQKYLKALGGIPAGSLSQVNSVDYRIMRNRLEYNLFQLEELREYEWNPLRYNIGGAIYALIARDFAPLKDRMRSVKERLKAIPAVLAQAKANLKNPPRVHTETAITQNTGTIGLVRDELQPFIEQVPELKAEITPVQAAAVRALEDYGAWLTKELLPRSTADFRLGDAKYRRKLHLALESDLSKEEILRRAEADLKSTQDAMYEVALPLYKKYFPAENSAARLTDRRLVIKAVLARLAEAHPTNETIVPLASEQVKSATDFVRQHNLVSVPEEPVKVIVMPEFTRGVAVAYCNAVGPFERRGETFYAISPTPKDWTRERTESFFREYNNYMLLDVTVHEAMPGHYLQLAHANKFNAPTRLRAIFQSNTFAEGWAVYAEQVMAERGFGGPEVRMQQLKLKLRTIINAILDQKIHTAGMTEKEALYLMMNEGFQEEGEAAGKWRRAQMTSTQLSNYYVGSLEVIDIRRAFEAKMGDTANFRQMHDTMLSFGSPAPKYVKELMGL
ncbi:MAG TPA: DUF885 domain-containing protein [Pyrinomonadaceae bacterium]|nr:DUF885 domain-containing protein [Pyrinomonadaceae bacterium]